MLTQTAARNVFYGGSVFFLVVFVLLTAHSHFYIVTESTAHAEITPAVERGKRIWERHSCINCHTLLGEGAYFAPELGNVWRRYGGRDDPESTAAFLKSWMRSQPSGVEGRRQMPAFAITDSELDDLVEFLRWVDGIDTQGWPPNDMG